MSRTEYDTGSGVGKIVSKLQACIERYGPEAGPKLHRALKSRAAYKGVSTRRRRQIEAMTGRPYRVRRHAGTEASPTLPLMPEPATIGQTSPGVIAAPGDQAVEGAPAGSPADSPCPVDLEPWNLALSRN